MIDLRKITIATLIVALFSTPFPLASAQAIEVTKLSLQSSGIGNVDVFVAKDGRQRLEMTVGTLIMAADDSAIGFNDENKLYVDYKTPEEFLHSPFSKASARQHSQSDYLEWKKVGTKVIDGIDTNVYQRSYAGTDTGFDSSRAKGMLKIIDGTRSPSRISDGKSNAPTSRTVTYVCTVYGTSKLPLHQKWVKAYSKAFGVYCPGGLPVRSETDAGGKKRIGLELKGWRKMNEPDSFFTLPKGYKLARDDFEVFLGGSAIETLYKGKY